MAQAPQIVQIVDLGHGPNALGAVKIRFITNPPFPHPELINTHVTTRGQWGFINEMSNEGQEFRQNILTELSSLLEDNTIIVLPEFAGGPLLTKEIQSLVRQHRKKHC